MLKNEGVDVGGRFDPLATAEYMPEGWKLWDQQLEFNAEDLEWLGFRPKSRVYRTVTHQQTKNWWERGHGPEQWGGTNAYAVNQSGLLLGSLHT